ncbi:SRPBCC family protein [Novosphingobium terrae]|uniref:SRPBCC family protein n=1 Tax=Novosphingobium terrae TaxID=2726189 RepID=UPI00197CE44D|nr:SRPBCC family protein [Novosphingobium terrae]
MTDKMTDNAPPATAKTQAGVQAGLDAMLGAEGDTLIAHSVTINRPRDELYAFWHDFARLPEFMDNLERVEVIDALRSHWVVKAPAGRTVEWDAIITEEKEGELIAWTSTDSAEIANSGRISFRDAGERGTVVTATIAYDPPGGVVGQVLAKLFQREPGLQARRDLRRFKQLMETGEIATNARTIHQRDEEKA